MMIASSLTLSPYFLALKTKLFKNNKIGAAQHRARPAFLLTSSGQQQLPSLQARIQGTILPQKGGDGIKPPPIIGRLGTSWKIGFVRLWNVGKYTFFSVLTNRQAWGENFLFCTINLNGHGFSVPDERFDFLCQYHKPASKIPPFLDIMAIVVHIIGTHNGQGLGNVFLSHISACEGIFFI